MLLIYELKRLRHNLLNNSNLSPKEKAFYQFLVDEPLNYPIKNNSSEIEQICFSVFGGDLLSKKELITRQRKKQPIHGMHYTKNLIELSAMAIDDVELEGKNLKSYCEKCTTREFYVLNILFPDISSNPPQPQGTIDQIALHLYANNFPQEGWKSLLLTGLYEVSDLIDFYIIEQGYQQAMDDNPIVHRTKDIIYARKTLVQIVAKTERRAKLTFKIVSVLLVAPTYYWLASLIIRNWDKAEPIMAVIQPLFYLIGVLFIIFVGFIPNRIKFLNFLMENVIDWIFRRKGLNRLELKETLDRLADQDEI